MTFSDLRMGALAVAMNNLVETTMANTEEMRLRDFVYLDVERVKSLLAQLDRGLLRDRSDSVGSSGSVEGKGGLSIPALFEVGGAGQYVATEQSTENRTLHDFVYTDMEEKLLELKRIKQLPADFTSDRLRDKDIRASLSPVEYALAKGRIELSDYTYMMSLLSNFNDISRIVTEFAFQERLQSSDGKARAEVNNELQKTIAARKLDDKYVKNLMKIFDLFVKDRLILKVLPFASDPNIRIVGPLQQSLLREKLDDIRFKFGSSPTAEWTIFGQIAAVPQELESRTSRALAFSNDMERAMHTVFEAMRGFEDQFRVSYPEIAITPIAVYRD